MPITKEQMQRLTDGVAKILERRTPKRKREGCVWTWHTCTSKLCKVHNKQR